MQGIDLSHHNGTIDFAKLLTSQPPVDFIYFKCSQGVGYIDPALKTNVTAAERFGVKWGVYHFASLNTTNVIQDAKAEAQHFLATVATLPKPHLPLVLDIEDDKGVHQYGLSKNDVLAWIHSFVDTLKAAGNDDYALYSYTPFLNSNLPAQHNLGSIRLWIAQYRNAPKPTLPAGWSDFWIWQYSDKGRINGLTSNVDMNISKSDLY